MPRYTIQNAKGLLYSDNEIPRIVYEPHPGNPLVNVPRSLLKPVFGAGSGKQALKYGSPEDARHFMAHPDLADPACFDGCEVVETEFDPLDMGAVRAVPVNP